MSRILEKIATAILEGDGEQITKLVNKALGEGMTPSDIMDNGLLLGMNEVGVRFKAGDMFVPEVLMSAEAMQAGTTILRPLLTGAGAKQVGKVLLGTVKGDLHDIGKNLVAMMCEGSGFEVIDIGFNADPEKFVEGVKKHQPQVVGMSAMLTTTMRAMGYTIKALEEAGLARHREDHGGRRAGGRRFRQPHRRGWLRLQCAGRRRSGQEVRRGDGCDACRCGGARRSDACGRGGPPVQSGVCRNVRPPAVETAVSAGASRLKPAGAVVAGESSLCRQS